MPSSCGKPTPTAWPLPIFGGSPRQYSTISPRRKSSARWNKYSGGVSGSSRVNHSSSFDDSPDMAHSKIIEQLPVIRYVANDQVGLLANFDGAKPVGAIQSGRGIERQRANHLGRQHFHLRAGQAADQWKILRRAGTGIAIAGQRDRDAGFDQSSGRRISQSQEKRRAGK